MKFKGQLVDRSSSSGLSVTEVWFNLFEDNEKKKKPLTDEQITDAMLKAFPKRFESAIFKQPNRVRNRYNRGVLIAGRKPKIESCRYIYQNGKAIKIKPNKKGCIKDDKNTKRT
jgi:hypothetical protein